MNDLNIKNEEQFCLNKVKFSSNGGLETQFQLSTAKDEVKKVEDWTNRSEDFPHPDLTELIDNLKKPMLFTVNGRAPINALVSKGNMMLDPKMKPAAIEKYKETTLKEAYDEIRITGLHFYHTDNGTKIKVSGGFDSPLGYAAITTPMIGLDEDTHGFGDSFIEDVERLVTEIFEYVVNKKRSQLDMFSDNEAEDEKTDQEAA